MAEEAQPEEAQSETGTAPESEPYVAQVVWCNWAHHVGVPWTERIGDWCVFAVGTVPYGWPNNGHRLALELTQLDIDELRATAAMVVPEIVPEPLPEPSVITRPTTAPPTLYS